MARGFWGSFNQGYGLGEKVWTGQAQNAKRRELAALGPEADVVQGQKLRVGDDVGLVSAGGVDERGNPISPLEAYHRAYANAAEVDQNVQIPDIAELGPGYAVRAGSYDAKVADKRDELLPARDRYNSGLSRRQADVYRRYGDDDMARTLERDAIADERYAAEFAMKQAAEKRAIKTHDQQTQLTGMQIEGLASQQKKQADLDFNLAAAMGLGTVEEQTAAILQAYRAFDPTAAAELERKYDTNTLNKMTIRAKELEQGYAEARQQGVDAVIAYYDKINDGFKLSRRGDTVYKLDNNDKVLGVFAKGDERQLLMTMDAYAKPGGFLEMAKYEETIRHNQAMEAIGRLRARGSGSGSDTSPAIQNFSPKDFVENAKLMGLPVQMDPKTGEPIYTEKHRQLMAGTQVIMAREGLPMWAAMQKAAAYDQKPDPEADPKADPKATPGGLGASAAKPLSYAERQKASKERAEAYASRHKTREETRAAQKAASEARVATRNAKLLRELEHRLVTERNPQRKRSIQEQIDALTVK